MLTELDLLLRALASPTRLRILAILQRAGPTGPAGRTGPAGLVEVRQPRCLASALGIARSTVTFHLKILLRMRLVRYVKSERYKFYFPARVHRGSIRSRLLVRLRDEIPADLGPVPPHSSGKPGRKLTRPIAHADANRTALKPVWQALTSFSHFRRLLMLEFLDRRGKASLRELMGASRLSAAWVKYHLDKLRRREVVSEGPEPDVYRLGSSPPTPLQGFLTRLLAGELAADRSSR